MKLEQDEIVVSYDTAKVNQKGLLTACEKSGFPATIATGSSGKPTEGQSTAEFSLPDFYSDALKIAKRDNKPLVLDFMATWCAPCKQIAEVTFVEENVADLLKGCVLLKIDTDVYPDLAKHFGVSGLPDIRLLNSDGVVVKKLLGFQPAETFYDELRRILD